MDISFYGWFWIILGAIVAPVEVVAYTVSIAKVFVCFEPNVQRDRYRIKKTNNDKRQTKLQGPKPTKRPNIMIIYDEERVKKFMSNGYRQGGVGEHSATSPSWASNNSKGVGKLDHKQNGGHGIQVDVEHNLVVYDLTDDLAEELALSRTSINHSGNIPPLDIADGDRSPVPNGTNIGLPNTHVDNITESGALLANDGIVANGHASILPDAHSNKKQRPTKPKRNQHRINHNKKPLLNDTDSNFNSSGENNTSIDEDRVSVTGNWYQHTPQSNTVGQPRRHSFTTADDTELSIAHMSLNLSSSEDNLVHSPATPHRDTNTANDVHGLHNSGFLESLQDVKFL